MWFWRAPGVNQHVFAIESFLDEMATASGIDPYQMRRKLLAGKPDWLKVLDTAAEKGDWGKPLPKGSGRGIAICTDCDSLCAQVAEVTVKPNGEVKVDRVTVALDTRYMVNPLTIAEQAEGSVIFGLSAALYGKITIKDGAAVQGNFDTYRMVRLAEAPKIDVHLIAERRQGVGRRRRAGDTADRRRGSERDLCRHRQAHSFAADQRPRSVRFGVAGAFDNRRGRRRDSRLLPNHKKAPGARPARGGRRRDDNFEGGLLRTAVTLRSRDIAGGREHELSH